MMWTIVGAVIGLALFIAVWAASRPRRNPAKPKPLKGHAAIRAAILEDRQKAQQPPSRTSGSVKRPTSTSGGYRREDQSTYTAAAQPVVDADSGSYGGDSGGGGSCD